MAGRLAGKVAVITGAASGIGAATARLFATEGARVALADVDGQQLESIVQEVRSSGGSAIGQETDVREPEQIESLVEATVDQFGKLDILYANAGIGHRGTVTEMDVDDFERLIAINLRGPFLCSRYAIPHIAAAGGGSVVFTASELALVGSPGSAVYSATKAGLIGMARSMALDHAKEGIRVNCICPGATDTPMLRRSIDGADDSASFSESILQRMPLGRLGQPNDIAQAALFLASDESSFVTGTALVVDGGWTAR
jgi:NAD(P)-dependent dehydrogenase (short-subunit alcohol dehydrogenase family)